MKKKKRIKLKWKICRNCGGRFKDPYRHYCN